VSENALRLFAETLCQIIELFEIAIADAKHAALAAMIDANHESERVG
jgi:hypothetical protein